MTHDYDTKRGSSWIDIISVVPFLIEIFFKNGFNYSDFEILRMARMLRIFRILKLMRHNENLRILIRTMKDSITEISFIFTSIAFTSILFGTAIYIVEKDINGKISKYMY